MGTVSPIIGTEGVRHLEERAAHGLNALRLATLRQALERTLSRTYCIRGDVRINCGRVEASMAQQHLYRADIGSALQQVRGKGVAQHSHVHLLA